MLNKKIYNSLTVKDMRNLYDNTEDLIVSVYRDSELQYNTKNIYNYARPIVDFYRDFLSFDLQVDTGDEKANVILNRIKEQIDFNENDKERAITSIGIIKKEKNEEDKKIYFKIFQAENVEEIELDEIGKLSKFVYKYFTTIGEDEVIVTEIYTKEYEEVYYDDKLIQRVEKTNGNIPIYIFPFIRKSGNVLGENSFQDIIEQQKLINSNVTKINRIINNTDNYMTANMSNPQTARAFQNNMKNVKRNVSTDTTQGEISNPMVGGKKLITLGVNESIKLLETDLKNISQISQHIKQLQDDIKDKHLEISFISNDKDLGAESRSMKVNTLNSKLDSIRKGSLDIYKQLFKDILKDLYDLGKISLQQSELSIEIFFGNILKPKIEVPVKLTPEQIVSLVQAGVLNAKQGYELIKDISINIKQTLDKLENEGAI